MPKHHSSRDRVRRGARGGHARQQLLYPLLSAGVLLSCAAPEDVAVPVTATGQLVGVVRIVDTRVSSESEPLTMKAAPVCESLNSQGARSQSLVSDPDGGLANVFVYVVDGGESPATEAPSPVVLEERDCHFHPRVLGLRAGQVLRVVNRDPTVHDPSLEASVNPPWSQTQPFAGMAGERVLEKTEVMIPVRCGIHPWMRAWIGVLPHSYFAVSDSSGEFAIGDLPPGRYRLEAWHESLGRQRIDVAISAGEITRVELLYSEREQDDP